MSVFSRSVSAAVVAGLALCGAATARAEDAEALKLLPVPVAASAAQDEGKAAFVNLFRQWKAVDRIATPTTRLEPASRAPMVAAASRSLGRTLRQPVGGFTMTSGFGMRRHPLLGGFRAHLGVDLAARMGTPVYATGDGVVSLAAARGGYGLSIALDHGAGMETRYGHLSRLAVATGQRVRKGDVIGYVGSTGLSTGPHLHYETRLNGQPLNPLQFMSKR